jgi:serine/threonine-protein kinase
MDAFFNEARHTARINHPNMVLAYDCVEHSVRGVNNLCIIMELVPGESLEVILKREKNLESHEALNIVAQTASVLAHCHAAGIIHGDIKPGNLLIMPSKQVKVIDLGISRALDYELSRATSGAPALGTVRYAAPERALGETIGPESDIYSLGCVAYEMLSGGAPFEGDSLGQIVLQHVNATPRALHEVNAAISQPVSDFVMKMIAKRKEHRPRDATEVLREAHHLLSIRHMPE